MRVQIDCYGFEAASEFFQRCKLEAYLVKNDGGIVYVCFGPDDPRPMHRIDRDQALPERCRLAVCHGFDPLRQALRDALYGTLLRRLVPVREVPGLRPFSSCCPGCLQLQGTSLKHADTPLWGYGGAFQRSDAMSCAWGTGGRGAEGFQPAKERSSRSMFSGYKVSEASVSVWTEPDSSRSA